MLTNNEINAHIRPPRSHISILRAVCIGLAIAILAAYLDGFLEKDQPTTVVPTAQPLPPIAIEWLPAMFDPLKDDITESAHSQGVDPELQALVLLVESGGHKSAVSPAGATGLMQIMPTTAISIAIESGMEVRLHDQISNLNAGAWLLADELSFFGLPLEQDPDWQQSVTLASAAYNGGRYAASMLDYNSLAIGGDCALHYPNDEMRRYACWIGGMWRERHTEESATYTAWRQYGAPLVIGALMDN